MLQAPSRNSRDPVFLGPRDTPDFHLRLIMPFHDLAFKVLQAHGRRKGGTDGLQVRLQGSGLSREEGEKPKDRTPQIHGSTFKLTRFMRKVPAQNFKSTTTHHCFVLGILIYCACVVRIPFRALHVFVF